MSGKYQAYPEYKDSGVEWLGQLPSHWKVGRLGSFGYFTAGCGFPHEYQGQSGGTYPFYKVSDTNLPGNEKFLDKAENYVSQDVAIKLGARIGKPGGIMFPKVGAALLGNKRRILTHPSITDNNTMVYSSYDGDYEYWYYWLSELDFGQISNPGPVPSVNEGQLKEFPAIFPPIEERKNIAAFLDHETARIDRLIEKQQRLIELLREKRQAVISHAVTKGLDPNVPMKDSGVEWLGQVPEHWKVSRIKNYAKIESGHTPDKKKAEYWTDCDIPWVSLNDSKTLKVVDYIDDTAYKVNELGIANSSARLLPAQAVVFTRDASIGLSAITTRPMAVSQHLIAWLCKSQKLLPEYLLLVFYGMEKEFERYTFGATIKTIGMDDVRSLSASFPPLAEQRAIVHWAFQKIKQLQQGVSKAEEAVGLLQERRTALISAAVTGKIDVRNWQPNTSTQSGEPDLPMAAEQAGRYHV